MLITAGVSFSGLLQRVARVNRMAPDLFLSIHHDSVPEVLLERWEYAGVQRRFSDRSKGHALFISSEPGFARWLCRFLILEANFHYI